MKIFVPYDLYRLPHSSEEGLVQWLVEIEPGALNDVLNFWTKTENSPPSDDPLAYNLIHNGFNVERNTFAPFLLRPSVSLYGCSKLGEKNVAAQAEEIAFHTGQLIAGYRFNLFYGGGDCGLMGVGMRGFEDKKNGHEHQYSVQVIPAHFLQKAASTNGFRPTNEGLCGVTDAAIITPNDLDMRKRVLRTTRTASLILPGSIGSGDELFNDYVHAKTGMDSAFIYVINAVLQGEELGAFEDLRQFVEKAIRRGHELPGVRKLVRWMKTPEVAMHNLVRELRNMGQDPETLYQQRLEKSFIPKDVIPTSPQSPHIGRAPT